MYKFTGFTEKANRALNRAIETAEDMGHTYIGSEHLLSALLFEETGSIQTSFSSRGITAQAVQNAVRKAIGTGIPTVLSPADFTPRAKNIIEKSISLAATESSGYVGTEHLFRSLLSQEESSAGEVLKAAGVSLPLLLDEITNGTRAGVSSVSPSFKRQRGQKSSTPSLDKYGQDLTAKAQKNEIDPVIGREKEIERVIQILSRRTKNNPCLIGEPGVGKTAIAEGLALKIVGGDVPEILKDKRLVTLDLTGMVAGTKYRGDFEERIKGCIAEVIKAKDVILFIDEVHNLIGTGSAEGAVDAANILKPTLARGELQLIGATTLNEYKKHIEKDSALERRFQPIKVGEPSEAEAVEILKGLRDRYEAHHKVKITDGAITAAVKLSARYISDRYLPDKAIDLVDEAASRVRLRSFTTPDEIRELEDKLADVTKEKNAAVDGQDFEKAAALRDREKELMSQITVSRTRWKEENAREKGSVSAKEISEIISSWTGIPVTEISKEEGERLLKMEEVLHKRVIGQDKAVSAVSRALRRGRSGLRDPKRPMGSFLFLGPTGVGKTELCKALAEAVFGTEDSVIRFDMSEFMDKHNTSRLVGSPPGYVGYDEGGQLTERVRRKPYSVILFDEIEKAHPDVFNIMLQLLDDGILTDSQGRTVSFKNTIIIMTSNLGAKLIAGEGKSIGFAQDAEDENRNEKIEKAVMSELKRSFRPEFINRLDEIIVFRRLKKEETELIADKLLNELTQRLAEQNITLTFNKEVAQRIAEAGFDPVYGARPWKRELRKQVEDPLSQLILEGKLVSGKEYVGEIVNSVFAVRNADESEKSSE